MSSARKLPGRTRGISVPAIADSVAATNLALVGASALGLIVTSRYLGVSDRGLYLTWSSWASMIGTLALLGTQSFIVVAAAHLEVRVSVWRLKPMLGGGVAVAGLAAFLALSWLEAGPVAVVGGVLLAVSGPVVAVNAAVQQANGHHNWRFNLARGLSPVLGLLSVVVILLASSPGAEGLFLGLGLGYLAGAVIAVVLAREPASPDWRLAHRVLELSRRGALLGLLGWLLLYVDTVVVSIAGSSQDVGLFGVGAAAKSVVLAVGLAVGLRWFASRGAIGSRRDAVRSFIPAVLVATGIVVVAPWAVPEALGQDFTASVPAVQLCAVGGVLAGVDFLLSQYLLVRVGYLWPTVVRFLLVLGLISGILLVGGQPTQSAWIFCSAMLASVLSQAALAQNRSIRRFTVPA